MRINFLTQGWRNAKLINETTFGMHTFIGFKKGFTLAIAMVLTSLSFVQKLHAEGTAQLAPSNSDSISLYVNITTLKIHYENSNE